MQFMNWPFILWHGRISHRVCQTLFSFPTILIFFIHSVYVFVRKHFVSVVFVPNELFWLALPSLIIILRQKKSKIRLQTEEEDKNEEEKKKSGRRI